MALLLSVTASTSYAAESMLGVAQVRLNRGVFV